MQEETEEDLRCHQSYTGTIRREQTLRPVHHSAFRSLEEAGARYAPPHSPLRKGELKNLYPAEGLEIGSVVYRYEDRFSFQRLIKRNSLVFDSHFECGNLSSVIRLPDVEGTQQYMLELSHDVHTKGHIQWFYFSVSNTSAEQEVAFYIRGFSKKDSLYSTGMRPLMFSEMYAASQGQGWRRVGSSIKYGEDPFHGRQSPVGPSSTFTLCFTHVFEYNNDVCFFAHSHPYSYTRLQQQLRFFDGLGSEHNDVFLERKLLTETIGRNRCDVVVITSRRKMEIAPRRPCCVVSARVHPGETNASWMMEGVMLFLVSNDPVAQALREAFVFMIVPMLNPDGVINGNYRTSLAGVDLNRRWDAPHPELHPTIYHLKQMLLKLKAEERLAIMVDLHGHSRKESIFMYGCLPDRKWIAFSNANVDEFEGIQEWSKETCRERFESEVWTTRLLPRLLAARNQMFSFEECSFALQPAKRSCMRMVCYNEIQCSLAYTLEASFSGKDGVHFSYEDLRYLGSDLCRAIADLTPVLYDRYDAGQMRLKKMRIAAQLADDADGDTSPLSLPTLSIDNAASERPEVETTDEPESTEELQPWRRRSQHLAHLIALEKAHTAAYWQKLSTNFPRPGISTPKARVRPAVTKKRSTRKAPSRRRKRSGNDDLIADDESVGSDSAPSDDNFDPMELVRCVRNAGLPETVTQAAVVVAKTPEKRPRRRSSTSSTSSATGTQKTIVPAPPAAPPPVATKPPRRRTAGNTRLSARTNVGMNTMNFEANSAVDLRVPQSVSTEDGGRLGAYLSRAAALRTMSWSMSNRDNGRASVSVDETSYGVAERPERRSRRRASGEGRRGMFSLGEAAVVVKTPTPSLPQGEDRKDSSANHSTTAAAAEPKSEARRPADNARRARQASVDRVNALIGALSQRADSFSFALPESGDRGPETGGLMDGIGREPDKGVGRRHGPAEEDQGPRRQSAEENIGTLKEIQIAVPRRVERHR